MDKIQKVLIVEDLEKFYLPFRDELRANSQVKIFWAQTIKKAEILLSINPDFSAIVMDACVPGSKPNTMPLIKNIIAGGFSGPIVTFSKDPQYNQILIEAGATHLGNKKNAAQKVVDLLKA